MNHDRDHTDQVQETKRPYTTPDLIEHGTVETITGEPGMDDGSPIKDLE